MKKLSLAEILNCFDFVQSIDEQESSISVVLRRQSQNHANVNVEQSRHEFHIIQQIAFVAGYRYPTICISPAGDTATWTWKVQIGSGR